MELIYYAYYMYVVPQYEYIVHIRTSNESVRTTTKLRERRRRANSSAGPEAGRARQARRAPESEAATPALSKAQAAIRIW